MLKLSICCLTYNHEKYISEALESFLAQEDIDFSFEIIISDDASKDSTGDIIRNYKNKYPSIIKPIFNSKNLGPIANFIQALSSCKGEYIAYCDGDDYWSNFKKIKKQITALDQNISCSFSFHDVEIVDNNKTFIGLQSKGRANEKWTTGCYNSRDVIKSSLTIPHANSIVFRRQFLDIDFLESLGKISAGDYPLTVMLASKGNAFYINVAMSAYRKQIESISSSRRLAYNDMLLKEIINTHEQMDEYYQRSMHIEISQHLKGQIMMKKIDEFNVSFENKSGIGILKSIIWLLLNFIDTQYTFRDIIWVIKNKLRTNWNRTKG